jgi:hypothetical protein
MTRNQPGIAIGIDFGEITTGLSGILGMAKGITEQRRIGRASTRIVTVSEAEFGAFADAAGASGEIAHVYEYGQEGKPSGRLWHIAWQRRGGDMVGNITFKQARRPTQVGSGIDPALARHAAASKRTLAQHVFPNKAAHLEETKTLVSQAGVQEHTRRVGGDVSRPSVLVYIDRGGNVRFAKRRRRANEFYGKFREVFMRYWMTQFEAKGAPRVVRSFTNTVGYGGGVVSTSIRNARVMSRPRIPRGMAGVFVTDKGRPFGGLRVNEMEASRVEKQVSNRMEKELTGQWR